LFRGSTTNTQTGLLWLGGAVMASAALAAMIRFAREQAPVPAAGTEAVAAE
jgi:hypothetical protein